MPVTPYYEQDGITIYHGDALDVLPTLQSDIVDIVWTDPPYGHNNNDGDLIHRWDVQSTTMALMTCGGWSMAR